MRQSWQYAGDTMTTTHIKTYSGESFRESYIQPEPGADALLKTDFGKFFVIKLEEMTRLMKLPVPPTRTTNHTLVYLTEGEAVMNLGSEVYKIGAGDCLVVPAGQVFSFSRVDRNRGYLCNFHNDFIVGKFGKAELLKSFEFLRVWGNPQIGLDGPTSAFVSQLFGRMLDWYLAHGLTRPDLIQSYFIALLCELNERYKPVSASPQTTAVTITNRFKELLFTYIKTHHRVTDYASLLTITPNHLNKSVRAITGKSPINWIDEAIVLEAKVLLHQTTGSISDVAAEVGIADSSYFSRLFKKYEGITPLAFRKMIEIA